jgi:hypothetical protein
MREIMEEFHCFKPLPNTVVTVYLPPCSFPGSLPFNITVSPLTLWILEEPHHCSHKFLWPSKPSWIDRPIALEALPRLVREPSSHATSERD